MKNRLGSRQAVAMLGVELHLRPHPAAPESPALAEGNHVFLNLREDFLGSDRSTHLLRHELCHVLQQRRGLAPSTGLVHGHHSNGELALEMEAEAFATGEGSLDAMLADLAATRGTQPSLPVMQRFTQVANKSVVAPHELSPKGQIILDLMPLGELWLRRMGAAGQQYVFESEPDFLVGIQQGLHGNGTLLLPVLKLMVSPHVLHAMSLHELERIRAVEQHPNEKNFDLNLRTTLVRQRLWSEAELVVGDQFLEHIVTPGRPVFSSRCLTDRIAIFELVSEASTSVTLNPMLQKEAAEFAVMQAQNALEFVDYYTFFMAMIKDPEPAPKLAPQRLRSAEALAYALTPVLFDYLWCPQFDPPPAPEELPSMLAAWCAQGYRLGFSRVSAALANVTQYAGLEGATGKAAIGIINRYMDRIQALWLERVPTTVRYSQSGAQREYIYRMPEGTVALQLATDGSLTIGSYVPETHLIEGSTRGSSTPTA
jgi:hypothetical protein